MQECSYVSQKHSAKKFVANATVPPTLLCSGVFSGAVPTASAGCYSVHRTLYVQLSLCVWYRLYEVAYVLVSALRYLSSELSVLGTSCLSSRCVRAIAMLCSLTLHIALLPYSKTFIQSLHIHTYRKRGSKAMNLAKARRYSSRRQQVHRFFA